ncbi:type II toxin-antitoxin system antitoxin HipB [Klebsiella electrica]|uniref:Type II toxin-antitoxin system antitoxin HipB n=1 Tax=Klebsiella electrica TaxID=1259973 RepID=A0AAJ5UHA4_9ENTR|nr:type II toxin-antitoxin system antitoxin HipB [Klebsiella electrica]WBW63772.1 type II toxin-antitoxin system antitoxin HipB [Klebsiella electrica]WIO40843.1 type II toxin-antitoxin system antitoxin HipB [Klebsiella electrica]
MSPSPTIYSPVQLANYLKLVRQKNQWTQSDLAQRMGIKQATVSNFENHPEKTTLTTVFKILQSLELSMVICEKNAPDSGNNRDNPQDLDW